MANEHLNNEESATSIMNGAHSRRALLRGAALAGAASVLPLGFARGGAKTSLLKSSDSVLVSHRFKEDEMKIIEQILQAQGSFSNGVFSIEIDRNDIKNVTLHKVPILPSFQLNGTICFEKISNGQVMMNGDMCLKSNEINAFIDALTSYDIVFQAEHQHFYDFVPIVWFTHFRAQGDAEDIARGLKAALNTTSTPFPQTMPSKPTTPLPAVQIAKILGGDYSIGSNGVVTIDIPREEPIILGGRRVNPYLNVQTNIVFEPYGSGRAAAAAPDFGMVAAEVQQVVRTMREQNWDVGCLYNQETDEQPQLFFSHMFKTGDSIVLAQEIRRGLDHTDVQFK